ncbi:MAG TPA: hypothetical protein VLZ12_11395 [Verrucomicrobiae bacterium]|nr:hypothetical protein [Verrucomicrobiae bacterium]
MLKRKGQIVEDVASEATAGFTHGERRAYRTAFETIQPEFEQLTELKKQMMGLRPHALQPGADSFGMGTVLAMAGVEWHSQIRLLKTPASEIFLCRNPLAPTFAVIQRFQADSPYAQANGNAEILLRGDDASQLVREFAAAARHTLRFMASNLVAGAQRVAWEQFPEQNPGKVVRAISERCHRLVRICELLTERESVDQANRHVRGMGV